MSLTENDMAIVERMKDIVPEFMSKHSKYGILEKQIVSIRRSTGTSNYIKVSLYERE